MGSKSNDILLLVAGLQKPFGGKKTNIEHPTSNIERPMMISA
jgi:hypothetical protein